VALTRPWALLLVCLLAACARPSKEEIATADYGSFPVDHEGVIRGHMARVLKDPYSAQYEFLNTPSQGYWGRTFGYRVCARVNAKNSFGGYTGGKLYYFLLRDGRVAKIIGGDSEFAQAMAQGACENVL
jgi:hypothetical protein